VGTTDEPRRRRQYSGRGTRSCAVPRRTFAVLCQQPSWRLRQYRRLGCVARAYTHDDFRWQPPFNLGAGVNSPFEDAGPSFFENDENGGPLLFFNSRRPGPGPVGTADIYVSQLASNGLFGAATRVLELSSLASEQRSSVRFDGLEIFFFSDRPGSLGADLWVSTREAVSDPWSPPLNLGAPINSAFGEAQPYIADRQTLFFNSNRPGGFGPSPCKRCGSVESLLSRTAE